MQPKVGISACLAGHQVRFSGGSLSHAWIDSQLAKRVQFVPLCPEVAMGLSTPRPALRLTKTEDGLRLQEANSNYDRTLQAQSTVESLVNTLPELDAYILASKSPLCGLDRIKVYTAGIPYNDGVGLFAQKLIEANPHLLIVDSGRLHNVELRELFLKSLFVMARFNRTPCSRSELQNFHRRHKFSLMAHHQAGMRELGRIAAGSDGDAAAQFADYRVKLIALLRIQPSRGNIINALEHMFGFLKHQVVKEQRSYFYKVLGKYRDGELTASVPLKILEMTMAGSPNAYLADQLVWQPVDTVDIEHVI